MTDIASHRGGALLWPENSLTAFENTARLPVEQVEFDVHPSADGRLVVIHDAMLDRTTDGSGPVSEKTFDELRRLTLKGTTDNRILLLDEVIEIFRPTSIELRIEIKAARGRVPYPGLAARVAEAVRDANMLDRAIFTSFQLETVCAAAARARPANHLWLVAPEIQTDTGLAALRAIALLRELPMLALRWDRLDAPAIEELRGAGLGVGGWAANDEAAITKMLSLGVDVFTTDRPDLAIQLRAALAADDMPMTTP